MKVFPLSPDMALEFWPLLKARFDSFSNRSFCTSPAQFMADVLEARKQCWVAYDGGVRAVALTSVQQGQKKMVYLTHCSGESREDWQEAIVAEVEKWAKSIGAERVRAECRPGWVRFLKGQGYRETHRIMERDIE